ncbi:signal peptidase I [Candidatus Roizmanbacteria bacterium]|nr:signal peptidase I [Candidatus Roizmanbacteria bacterium]
MRDHYFYRLYLYCHHISSKTNLWEGGFLKEGKQALVPQDYIFVLGDNRDRSSDSREFGFIPVSSIVGQTVYRFFPPTKIGFINH